MDTEEIIGLSIVGSLMIAAIVTQIINKFNEVKPGIIGFFTSKYAFIAYSLIVLSIMIYYNYKFNYWLIKKREKIKEEKEYLARTIEDATGLLEDDIEERDSKTLKDYLDMFEEHLEAIGDKNSVITEKIDKRIGEIKLIIPRIIEKEKLKEIHEERDSLEESVKELKEEERQKRLDIENFEETSLRKLNADNNPVFIEKDLTRKAKALLLKYGYKRAYEYCIDKQDFIHVLVKPTMKHSVTHTFLVWSVMKMLSKMNGIKNAYDWDTREADITFAYNKKKFALEIETGTLLKKKVQLRNKIDYLNSKYKDCWMIIVSKKNLAPKYSKLGKVSSRSEVPKKLKKLLKLAPPS